jgi:hypothetical protein
MAIATFSFTSQRAIASFNMIAPQFKKRDTIVVDHEVMSHPAIRYLSPSPNYIY